MPIRVLLIALVGATLAACTVRVTDDLVFQPPARPSAPMLDRAVAIAAPDGSPLGLLAIRHGRADSPVGPIAYTHHFLAADADQLPPPPRPLAIVCMGNAADRPTNGWAYASDLAAFADVLVWDYPGYGESAGSAAAADVEQALSAPFDALRAEGVDLDRPMFFWGHSLGGFVCSQMAARTSQVDGVALVATSTSTLEAARDAFTPWYARPFLRYRVQEGLEAYDNIAALSAFEGPILVLQPQDDDVFPASNQAQIVTRLSARGRDVIDVRFDGVGHDDFDRHPDFDAVVANFVAQVEAASD